MGLPETINEKTGAERIFRFLQDPAWVGAICLKKPERIVALGYVMLMAVMVYTLHGDTWRLRRRIFADYPLGAPR